MCKRGTNEIHYNQASMTYNDSKVIAFLLFKEAAIFLKEHDFTNIISSKTLVLCFDPLNRHATTLYGDSIV